MRVWCFILLGLLPAAAVAEDALAILGKMAAASRTVNYSGTFVFQHGGQVEMSSIAHFVNPAGGVFERLETMDGPAREVIRTNEQVTCYMPGIRTVLIDPRGSRQLSIEPEQIPDLAQHYRVVKGSLDRVAGFECQWVALLPQDNLRYARRFCADVQTGLTLRSVTLNEKNETVEAFAFTTLQIGGPFRRDMVQSRYAAISSKQNWRVDRSALTANDTGDSGWAINDQPAGFRKVLELRRSMPGKKGTVSHLVFSDGLAAISVFIEPGTTTDKKQTLRHQGAVYIYSRPVAGHTVTVLGETPAETVMRFAKSVEPKTVPALQR